MKRLRLMLSILLMAIVVPGLSAAAAKGKKTQSPFEAVRMIIEFNSTDQDVGIQLSLDAEAWKNVSVIDPNGHKVFDVNAKGALKPLGGSELFLEGDEPGLDELPLQDFFTKFPEGMYRFVGKSPDGESLESTATFSHKIPDGPTIVSPATLDPAHAVIAWNPVTTPAGIDIAGYEIVIEQDDFHVFDIKVPSTKTSVTVPPEFLQPATQYGFEVLAIDRSGNQTITAASFVTPQLQP
jgi:hypothetical protein